MYCTGNWARRSSSCGFMFRIRADLDTKFKCPLGSLNISSTYVSKLVLPTRMEHIKRARPMRTDVEGEYLNWRESLHLRKRCVSPEKTCHLKGQARRSTEPGASNLLSLLGIRRRESRSIRLN